MKKTFPDQPSLLLYASKSWNLGLASERLKPLCRSISTFSDPSLARKFVMPHGDEIDCAILILERRSTLFTPLGLLVRPSKPVARLVSELARNMIFSAVINPNMFWDTFDRNHLSPPPMQFNDRDRAVGKWPPRESTYLDLDWPAIFAKVQGEMHNDDE